MPLLIKDECSLCGEIYPYYSLNRCNRCKRFYCGNCIIFTENKEAFCLNCARRMVSPKSLRGKYSYLSIFLARKARYRDQVTLTFRQIEEIIGDRLPFSSYNYKHWWSNTQNRSPSEAWLTVGWTVVRVDLDRKEVTFHRERKVEVKTSAKRRRQVSKSLKSRLRPSRLRRRREPSKSRTARVQARLKNLERVRSMPKEYRGKLKPRGVYEKRLYKPQEK